MYAFVGGFIQLSQGNYFWGLVCIVINGYLLFYRYPEWWEQIKEQEKQ